MKRNLVWFGDINNEGIKLIAKLGAADPSTLRQVLEDVGQAPLRGRWSKYRMIETIVTSLDFGYLRAGDREARRIEDALIHHGLWAGAKRSK